MVKKTKLFFLLIWFSLEPPSFHHPSSSSSKTKKHSLFCSRHHFQECCLLPESHTAPLFPISDSRDGLAGWDLSNRNFFSAKSSICVVPCTCCCQWALQGPQELWQQAEALQRASGFICISLQVWLYQFWVASFVYSAILAVLHRALSRFFLPAIQLP